MSEQIARQFHDIYERLAPQFGYETREDTKVFEPQSQNGRLMIAVCAEVIGEIKRERDEARKERDEAQTEEIAQFARAERLKMERDEARAKCAELQAGLDDIEEYGTEEVNAAVDLRHQLAKVLCERDKATSVAERLVEYAHECLVKLQSWGQGYRRYEEEMDAIREDIAAYNMMKEALK